MRIAIVSDIHSNLWALKEVLEHIETQGVDKKACLGDLIGYGPYPNECVELTVQEFNFIVKGNHDEAIHNQKEANTFTPMARRGIDWTKTQIHAESLDILKNLEYGFVTDEGIMFIHGNPCSPFMYTIDQTDALNGFLNPVEDFDIAFVGHTHVAEVWEEESNDKLRVKHHRPDFGIKYDEVASWVYRPNGKRAIVNVGSIGQPRDGDKRASYVIYDSEQGTIEYFRIPYAADKTIAKMQRCGFAHDSWSRLMYGR